jgi:hypothetical protein
LSRLGTSFGDHDDGLHTSYDWSDNHNEGSDGGAVSAEGSDGGAVSSAALEESIRVSFGIDRSVGWDEIRKLGDEIVRAVGSVPNQARRNEYFGEMIRFMEIINGNSEAVEKMSTENLLDVYFSAYNSSSTGNHRSVTGHKRDYEESSSGDDGSLSSDEVSVIGKSMKRSCPVLCPNHGKKRKRSIMEIRNKRMVHNNRRNQVRSLCLEEGHRARGYKCRVVSEYKANLIKPSDVMEMAARLGNPAYYEVRPPDEETGRRIVEWTSRGGSKAVPSGAWHLVLLNIYFSEMENNTGNNNHNWIEVTVLGKGGNILTGWEMAYFPPHEIGVWLERIVRRGRERSIACRHCGNTEIHRRSQEPM